MTGLIGLTVLELAVGVGSWEADATRWMHDQPDELRWVLRPAMEFGNRAVALAIAVTVGVTIGRRAGVQVLLSATAAWLLAIGLKVVIRRPRITADMLDGPPRSITPGWSFPSGHTSIAFALAVALILVTRSRWHALWLVVAAGTALARLYVGVHYPIDVAGGACVGVFAAVGVCRRPPHRRPFRPS